MKRFIIRLFSARIPDGLQLQAGMHSAPDVGRIAQETQVLLQRIYIQLPAHQFRVIQTNIYLYGN